jgi:hypothetical protein
MSLRFSYGELEGRFPTLELLRFRTMPKTDLLELCRRSCQAHLIIQPPVTPFSRQLDFIQEVPGRPGSLGSPWNLPVSLRVSRKRSYGRWNAGDQRDVKWSELIILLKFIDGPISGEGIN